MMHLSFVLFTQFLAQYCHSKKLCGQLVDPVVQAAMM